jgi:hypothetical protein
MRRRSRRWPVAGKLHKKRGSVTRRRFRANTSSVGLCDRPCDRQAEPAPALVTSAAFVEPPETLEDLLELVRRDSGPAVADRDLKPAVSATCRDDDSIARTRVCDGVADQVAHDLRQAVRISSKAAVHGLQLKVTLAEQREVAAKVLEELAQVDRAGLDQLACLGAGEGEHVRDEPVQLIEATQEGRGRPAAGEVWQVRRF